MSEQARATAAEPLEQGESYALARYAQACEALVRLALNRKQSGAVRVAAHRVYQEYIIKPIKDQIRENKALERKASSSTPALVSVAINQLPVGTGVTINAVASVPSVARQQDKQCNQQLTDEWRRMLDSNPLQNESIEPVLDVGPPLGEAAEKSPTGFIDTSLLPENFPVSNKGCTIGQGQEYDCEPSSKRASKPFESRLSFRKTRGQNSVESAKQLQESKSGDSSGATSSNSPGKTYEEGTEHDLAKSGMDGQGRKSGKGHALNPPLEKNCKHCGQGMTDWEWAHHYKYHVACQRARRNDVEKRRKAADKERQRRAKALLDAIKQEGTNGALDNGPKGIVDVE